MFNFEMKYVLTYEFHLLENAIKYWRMFLSGQI
jgi:hypothetical protein